jgi:hypothetical protein
MSISFYMYDMTNVPEVLGFGAKPEVKEVGPFIYSMGWERYNLTWSDDEDELSFQEWAYFNFVPCPSKDPENVPCSPHDDSQTFTMPNLAFHGIYYAAGSVSLGIAEHAVGVAKAWASKRVSALRETQPQDVANLVQKFLIDSFFILPGLREHKTMAEIEESLFVEKLTPPQMIFGWDNPVFVNLSTCQFGIWDDVCGILDGDTADCDYWLDNTCPKTILGRLGECAIIKTLRALSAALMHDCPNIIKQSIPPTFPGIGYTNDTSKSISNLPAGMDRTTTIKTGKVDVDHAFELTKRWGMEVYKVCPVNIGRPALFPNGSCPFGASPALPYKAANASRVYGLNGMQTKAFLNGTETFPYWIDSIARAVTIEPTGERPKHRGIENVRYKLSDKDLQSVAKNPANDMYSQYGPSGFFNLTVFESGMPLFLSQPHFFGVDDDTARNNLKGMPTPDADKDQFIVDVEPVTGMIMGGHGRLQITVQGHPIRDASFFGHKGLNDNTLFEKIGHFKNFHMPVLWLDQGGTMSDFSANKWKSTVGLAIQSKPYVIGGNILLACVCFIVAGCLVVKATNQKRSAGAAPPAAPEATAAVPMATPLVEAPPVLEEAGLGRVEGLA